MKLLKKEFRLCMHPTGYILPLMAVLILVPGYPYGVCCFYTTMVIYFICLTARENHDASYTLTLPVTRRDAVNARILFCTCLEAAQIVLMALVTLAKYAIGTMANPAGLDAGLAMIGEGLLIFALFNMIFFPLYYKDINKPGAAFLIASAAVFAWIVAEIVATYTVPFVRFRLDQPDPAYMGDKALFTAGALALFLAGTASAAMRSAKKFEAADLSL
ncbi:MAG: ABC-2 transporter permease [Clostridia bacterium]|nr:ABC-2 transporter permease [Clostridia bacterium]